MPLRVAVSGLKHGHVLSTIEAAVADPGIEIVGIAEGHEVYRRDRGGSLPVAVEYSDHTQLLDAKQFDVLVICEEFGRRGQVAIDALKAGRHVFSDKPLCTREDELQEIASLAGARGLEVGVDFSLRWMWGPIGAALRDGIIGSIVALNTSGPHSLAYEVRPKWYFEEGMHGGIINDLLGHGVDYARWIARQEITQVLSATRSCVGLLRHPRFQMAGSAHFAMGACISLFGYVDYLVPEGHAGSWHMHVVGSEGDAMIDEAGQMCVRRADEPASVIEAAPHDPRWKHPFIDFADLIRDGTRPLRTTEDALRTSMATLVAQRAADTGTLDVPVPLVHV